MKTSGFAAIAIVLGVLAGCVFRQGSKGLSFQTNGPSRRFVDDASLKPSELPYTEVRIVLAGTEVPATMQRVVKGKDVLFRISAKNEVLEEEHYESDERGFRFSSLTGEQFVPPIPLVRYPFTVGESWDWNGDAGLGPTIKPATATISTSNDKLNLATGVADCVKVTVNLVVTTSDQITSKRPLFFWFEPKKGLVKREFAYSSTREPRPKATKVQ